jgi:acetoin utilization protein AcuB
MRVEDLMTSKVFVVEQDDYVDRVFFLIHYERIRHLPVVEKGKVIGIVSDRDLYKALGPKSNSNAFEDASGTYSSEIHMAAKKVRHIMHRGVISVKRDTPAAEAAALMADNKIGALPVVDKDNKLVGILSSTDILRVFSKIANVGDAKERKSQPGKPKTTDSI